MPESLFASSAPGPEMDPDKVADYMVLTAQALPKLLDEYIVEGSTETWLPVSRWLLREGGSNPEERWGVLETVATLTMIVVSGSGGLGSRYFPELEADLLATRVDDETIAGVRDAYRLITSEMDPGQELDDSWLMYADGRTCSAYRYAAAAGAMLIVMSALIAEAAYHANMNPVEVWREVLPVAA